MTASRMPLLGLIGFAVALLIAVALAIPSQAQAVTVNVTPGCIAVNNLECEVATVEQPGPTTCSDGFTWNVTGEACVQDVVDACPDANNPGVQGVGATCHVPEPEMADAPAPVWDDPAVNLDHTPELGSAAAIPTDDAVGVLRVDALMPTAVAGVSAGPTTAGAGIVEAPSGDLPFTGATTDVVLLLALVAFLLGTVSFADARRAARRTARTGA